MLNVTAFQETLHADMCGPASLKIVLDYYGVNKTERELADIIGVVPEIGVDAGSIKKVAEELGFKVVVKDDASFNDIQMWLERGVPVIVDWFTRGRADYDDAAIADGHYSVVIGLDDEYVHLQDPEIGGVRKLRRDDFLKVWFDFRGKYITADELIIRQIIAVYT